MTEHIAEYVRLPHRWPGMPSDGDPECIAWKCAACGEWVSEYRPYTSCTVDWRSARIDGRDDGADR